MGSIPGGGGVDLCYEKNLDIAYSTYDPSSMG